MSGTLYIVATPIGNLKDVTLRSINILSDVDIILAEDTRVTRKLLNSILGFNNTISTDKNEQKSKGISKEPSKNTKLVSYHQHSGEAKKLEILNYLLNGDDIALVTDAGTPGVSDPGGELIEYLLGYNKDLSIVPIPGPSAVQTLLSVSGFDVSKYIFLGFLPKKKMSKILKIIKEAKLNFCYFDSPHRVVKNLIVMEKTLGSYRNVVVGRELTKIHETLYRGSLRDVIKTLENEKLKGEITVVIEY